MNTREFTYQSLFGSSFEFERTDIVLNKIEIPIIQRDYAQGRKNDEVQRIRERFLDALFHSIINKKHITLDFVYGDVSKEGVFTPLDGQQRLTTLFLLHWYIAKKETIDQNECKFLNHFSYATRFSSRDFCTELVKHTPDFNKKELSETIQDQAWYPYEWKNDPTIQSMLVMIDAIHEKFNDHFNLWKSLVIDKNISFFFLPLKEMGLTDDLYIKMNSRGKPLTQFEHFKAEFEDIIKQNSEKLSKEINHKFDIEWTDMLFPFRGDNNIIDDEFMRYFHFISDIITYKSGFEIERDEFKLARLLYSIENDKAKDNIFYLKNSFDCWYKGDVKKSEIFPIFDIYKDQLKEVFENIDTNVIKFKDNITYCEIRKIMPENTPKELMDILQKFYKFDITNFFKETFSNNAYQIGKVKIYQDDLNIFKECLDNYGEYSGRNRRFPLNKMLLLYSIIIYLQNKESITEDQFRLRIRVIRNLIWNSSDEIRDNRMKALLSESETIIITGEIPISERGDLGYNVRQKEEEYKKIEWLRNNSQTENDLFHLEDHSLLKGCIAVVDLQFSYNFNKFRLLFNNCDKDLINRALLCNGDYSQLLSWRYQIGVKSNESVWFDLFHPTKQRQGFDKTLKILNGLLDSLDESNINDENLELLITKYLDNSAVLKDWRYYIIKYNWMRQGNFGMYYWKNHSEKPYEIIMMNTEKSIGGRNWDIYLYSIYQFPDFAGKLSLGEYAYQGGKLKIKNTDIEIECYNNRYDIIQNGTRIEYEILQLNGIDIEDRIEKGKQIIMDLLSSHHAPSNDTTYTA